MTNEELLDKIMYTQHPTVTILERGEYRAELLRRLASAAPAGQPTAENYVAWCRYTKNTIVTCDSDAPGAFKVYRAQVTPVSPGKMEISTEEYGNLLAIWQTAVMLFSGPPNELPDVEKMRRRMHEAVTPVSGNGTETK